jgi:hypothetical protein
MNSEKYLSTLGALLLVWSMPSAAHDSHEAMMAGGNLLQLTRAAIHPFLETPQLPTLLIGALILGCVLGPVLLHISRRRIGGNAIKLRLPRLKKYPRVIKRA